MDFLAREEASLTQLPLPLASSRDRWIGKKTGWPSSRLTAWRSLWLVRLLTSEDIKSLDLRRGRDEAGRQRTNLEHQEED